MCVGLPARVEKITDGVATVSVSGVTRDVPTNFVPNIKVGDYLMIHAGIAIARITAEEAEETQEIFEELYGQER